MRNHAGVNNRPVWHALRKRLLRAGRVLPGGVPCGADAHKPGDDRPPFGAVQPELIQRWQSVSVGAQHLARKTRREVERAHVQLPSGILSYSLVNFYKLTAFSNNNLVFVEIFDVN